MSMMMMNNPVTTREMIAKRAPLRFRGGSSQASLMRSFRSAEDRLLSVARDCNEVAAKIGMEEHREIAPTSISADIGLLDHEEAREHLQQRYETLVSTVSHVFEYQLEDGAKTNHVGRLEWIDDPNGFTPKACRFNFYTREKSRTLTKIRTRTIEHVHDLVDAKAHRLPAPEVKKPKACIEIINAMSDWMKEDASIITGTQILANIRQVDETYEDNEVVRGIKATRRGIVRGARAIGRGTQRVAAVMDQAFLRSQGFSSREEYEEEMERRRREREERRGILFDPALVIGDFVLIGWN